MEELTPYIVVGMFVFGLIYVFGEYPLDLIRTLWSEWREKRRRLPGVSPEGKPTASPATTLPDE